MRGSYPSVFQVSKHQKPNLHTLSHIGISQVGNSGLACTRDLPLDIPGVEIPRHQDLSTLLLFRGFTSQGFVTGEYKGTDPWVSRVTKHRNIQTLDTLCHFRVSQVGISGLASTRDFPLDIPSAETLKHHILSALLLFRGLASWDFGTGE